MSKNKTRTKDKYRVVYNDTQRIELENEFRLNEYIAIPRKQEIAHKLQLSERQIKIWFQNRRAKKRKQQKRRQSAVSTNTATSTTTTASPGTTTPISIKQESVSPPQTLYPTIHQHNKITNSTTSAAPLKSPGLSTPEHRSHYQPESIYQNQLLGQDQRHQQALTTQYYEPTTNYSQDQEQYAKGSAISMQTNHQRHNFNASWSSPANVGVNPLLPPHQVAVSPQLTAASPPTAPLTNQHFHHHHHHHQQSISPYSHHNATSYLAAQTNGYVMSGSQLESTISQSAHRLQADSGVLHQHFMSQQPAPAPTHHHHHSPHPHAQLHTQQHYHQPLTQMQSQNHVHHHHNQLGMSSGCNGAINI